MDKKEERESIAVPDYYTNCEVCGRYPTIDIRDSETNEFIYNTGMCGACTWGEADCIDPENW